MMADALVRAARAHAWASDSKLPDFEVCYSRWQQIKSSIFEATNEHGF